MFFRYQAGRQTAGLMGKNIQPTDKHIDQNLKRSEQLVEMFHQNFVIMMFHKCRDSVMCHTCNICLYAIFMWLTHFTHHIVTHVASLMPEQALIEKIEGLWVMM